MQPTAKQNDSYHPNVDYFPNTVWHEGKIVGEYPMKYLLKRDLGSRNESSLERKKKGSVF